MTGEPDFGPAVVPVETWLGDDASDLRSQSGRHHLNRL